MDRFTARDILAACQAPINIDFHRLGSSEVECLLSAAKQYKYRQPKNANGSKARCFHAFLVRVASRTN